MKSSIPKTINSTKNVPVQIRISPQLRKQAEDIFNSIGLDLPGAIRVFLQQTVNYGDLPFQLVAKHPNAETLEAMKEVEDVSSLASYKNFGELRKRLKV